MSKGLRYCWEDARPWLLHPYLFAAFPVLSLWSRNAGDVSPVEVAVPLSVVLCVALLLRLMFAPFFRHKHKLGIVLSGGIALFFAYGPAVDLMRGKLHDTAALTPMQIGLAIVCLAGAAAGPLIWLWKTRRPLVSVTMILNRISGVAVIIATAGAAWGNYAALRDARIAGTDAAPRASSPVVADNAPDIYYILLDAYGRSDVLSETFGYDNSPFLSGLQQRGFYVASDSYSNYCRTVLSMPSSLNMTYLPDEWVTPVHQGRGQKLPLARMIRHNAVAEFLRDHGYSFVSFAVGWAVVEIHNADMYLAPRFGLTEFSRVLIELTPVRSVLNRMSVLLGYQLHAQRILYMLDTLGKLERRDKPLFVYAHVPALHLPHVLDENGHVRDSLVDFHKGYADQIPFLNRKVTEIVDSILARNPNSVIIIQGDHGPCVDEEHLSDENRDWYVRDKSAILNAYYLPGVDTARVLYPGISPVNTFRVVLDEYFNAGYELLEDVTRYTDPGKEEAVVSVPHPRAKQ